MGKPHRILPNTAYLLGWRKVWSDPLYLILPDRVEGGEQRWHAIGMVGAVVVLVVVHNHPQPDNEDRVRIISARKATAHERKRYEKESASC